MKIKESIALILPAYNEENLLEETVKVSVEKLSHLTDNYEILIVDDASTDRTGEIAYSLSAKSNHIKVLHNLVNLGIGVSLIRGMKSTKGDYTFYNGVDMPFDINDIEKILPLMEKADIVVAVRTDRSAYSLWRKITSIGNVLLLKLFFGIKLSDMSFIQVFKRAPLEDQRVINVISRSPAFVIPELLIRAKLSGHKIITVDINYHKRKAGKSSYGKPHDIIWTFYDMLRFRFKLGKLHLKK